MTELRRQMLQAMTVRGLARRTQESYVSAVRRLAKHYRRPPDQLTTEEVQSYLAHMIEVEKLSWSTCAIAANAFRFETASGDDAMQMHVYVESLGPRMKDRGDPGTGAEVEWIARKGE